MSLTIYLAPIFLIAGEPTLMADWMPREQPSIEICEERAEYMNEHMLTYPLDEGIEFLTAFCGTREEIIEQFGYDPKNTD